MLSMSAVYEICYPITLILICFICTDEGDSNAVQSAITPHQANSEFVILLENIIKELRKNESKNLEIIRLVSILPIKVKSGIFLFNSKQREAINASSNIRTLFTKHLRSCWRWYEFTVLKAFVEAVRSEYCETMIRQYEEKLDIQMKLQQIYEHCIQEKRDVPDGYDKMVAILHGKIFSCITKAEYDELKKFISTNLGVESYVIPPFGKVSTVGILCVW